MRTTVWMWKEDPGYYRLSGYAKAWAGLINEPSSRLGMEDVESHMWDSAEQREILV